MIDAREYETREDLERAMIGMHRMQLEEEMRRRYSLLKSDHEQIAQLMAYPFLNKAVSLDRSYIYRTADRIEELSKRMALTASIMKSTTRLIPKILEEDKADVCSTTDNSQDA